MNPTREEPTCLNCGHHAWDEVDNKREVFFLDGDYSGHKAQRQQGRFGAGSLQLAGRVEPQHQRRGLPGTERSVPETEGLGAQGANDGPQSEGGFMTPVSLICLL